MCKSSNERTGYERCSQQDDKLLTVVQPSNKRDCAPLLRTCVDEDHSEHSRQDRGLARTFLRTTKLESERVSRSGTATVEGRLGRVAGSRISTIKNHV